VIGELERGMRIGGRQVAARVAALTA